MSNASDNPRKALGKGIASLLPGRYVPSTVTQPFPATQPKPEAAPETSNALLELPIDQIQPNPLNPRTIFQKEKLDELAQSIKANGIIQPLVVRKAEDGTFQLIAGERRWRASKLAGLEKVPVVVQNFAEDRLLEITLIENIQREDLNPMEVAQAFEKLSQEHGLSHEEIGNRTGKDRSTVSNTLRLLRLPTSIQLLLAEQKLSMGHARAILGLPTEELQCELAEKAAAASLSVRQVEQLVQKVGHASTIRTVEEVIVDPNVKAAIRELESTLGTRVRIVEKGPNKGRIEIEYYSSDDLDRIYTQIVGEAPM